MICRISGRVRSVSGGAAEIDLGSLCYEILIPASTAADLQRLSGEEVVLHTIQYIEGNPSFGQLTPRLIGFLSEIERDFYNELLKVKGMGMRKALRAMSVPAHQIAAAIERGEERTLATLPEVGKKTAAQIITDLRGKLERFLAPAAAPIPAVELTDAQRVAVEILVQWGDRRPDAQRWVAEAVQADAALTEPDAIVRAAYKLRR